MVESIYDNTQISSVGTDLLRFGFGIFSRFTDEPGGDRNCWVSFGGGFGDTQSQYCLGGDRPGYDRFFIWNNGRFLQTGSTLAGNLTLLGSVANLIVAEIAEKADDRLTFQQHLRFGLPLTLVTVGIAYFWIY